MKEVYDTEASYVENLQLIVHVSLQKFQSQMQIFLAFSSLGSADCFANSLLP